MSTIYNTIMGGVTVLIMTLGGWLGMSVEDE